MVFLSDTLSGGEWLGILVVVAGLVSLVRPGVSTVALAGWVLLHERMGRARVLSSAVIAAGLVMLVALH